MSIPLTLALTLALAPGAIPRDEDKDTDRDGLSDFQELHKYGTDPRSADTDRDGIPDGDWFERREHAYVVRTVVQVLKPVTPEYLNDDFQDARVLAEFPDRFELEVVHYPFSTAPEALPEDTRSRDRAAKDREVARWLKPGPTSDWDTELRRELTAALEAAGIDVERSSDAELVRSASEWLVQRARSVNGFTAFSTDFDERGRPFTPEELLPKINGGVAPTAEDWSGELSAKGMFQRSRRGTCTSSAIYLSGCLRALGIPTRTVLCIPLFDANDEREWALVEGALRQPTVRTEVLAAMEPLRGHWASHTFNEVWIDGRWWRLDYSELGVGIQRRERFGLMTHVATFHDWADADAAATIGRRDALRLRDAVLDGPNPYSMQSISEAYGAHLDPATLPVPELVTGKLEAFYWFDDPSLPEDVLENLAGKQYWGLVARLTGPGDPGELRELLERANKRIYLHADGHPRLGVGLDAGCWWFKQDHALVCVPFGRSDREQLVAGIPYRVELDDTSTGALLTAAESLAIQRD